MPAPTFIVTNHAAERFRARCVPHMSPGAARKLLTGIAETATRVPLPPHATHDQWRIAEPTCVLVTEPTRDETAHIVMTVLGPGELDAPIMRTAVPSQFTPVRSETTVHGPAPMQRRSAPKRYHRRRGQGQVALNVGLYTADEMARYDEERALLGPTPAQREQGCQAPRRRPIVLDVVPEPEIHTRPVVSRPAVTAAPPTPVVPPNQPMSPELRAARGVARATAVEEFRRRAEGARMVTDMIATQQATMADAEVAVNALADQMTVVCAVFTGKANTVTQFEHTLAHARNRLASLRMREQARQRGQAELATAAAQVAK